MKADLQAFLWCTYESSFAGCPLMIPNRFRGVEDKWRAERTIYDDSEQPLCTFPCAAAPLHTTCGI